MYVSHSTTLSQKVVALTDIGNKAGKCHQQKVDYLPKHSLPKHYSLYQ